MTRAATIRATSDLAAATRDLYAANSTGESRDVTIPAKPSASHRVRVAKNGGRFYVKSYQEFIKAATAFLAPYRGTTAPLGGPLIGVIETVVQSPAAGKTLYPKGDADNYAKAPLDVMKKIESFFNDDDQFVGVSTFKRYTAGDEPEGIQVTIYPLTI